MGASHRLQRNGDTMRRPPVMRGLDNRRAMKTEPAAANIARSSDKIKAVL